MKIKVLALSYLFPNPENPGYGVFVFNRLQAVKKYCDVKVIAPQQWFPFLNYLRRTPASKSSKTYVKFKGMDVFYPRFFSIPKYLKWLDALFYFFAILPTVFYLKHKKSYDFDIVDVHWTFPDILAGFILARFYKKKFIVTIRGKEALYLNEAGGRRWILNYCLKKADSVICLSSELKKLVQDVGVDPDKIEVIYNGIDPGTFSYLDQKMARNELLLPVDKKIIVSVGSLIRRKGHHILIENMANLSIGHDVDLYIVGGINPEGDYSLELKQLVAEKKITNVHFVEPVDHSQLPYWYAAADLFCLATAGEGCPNVVLESMACGCPVVVSDVGAVSDIVRVPQDGLIVKADENDWEEKIETALRSKWDRKKIADRISTMDWDSCAKQVVEQYNDALAVSNQSALEEQLKIIYHHRTLGDGAEGIHIREMIAAFRSLGHQVRVIGPAGETVPEKGGGGGWLSKIKSILPNFVFELCEIGYSAFSFIQLSWIIFCEKPDFIYDRYITFNVGCVLAAKIQKKPLFLEVNAPLALERSEQPDERLYLKRIAFAMERWACSNSFKTIVVSTPLKEYLVAQGVAGSNIVVMPNGVNTDKFYPHEKDQILARELGIPENVTVIGFTGVLRHWHGLEMLIDAFSYIVKTKHDTRLLIVGDGPIRKDLDEQISCLGLKDKVIITGLILYDDVPKYVNLFDIAVSPKATFYASPMKVIEYMALGKAVVVPNSGNFLDIIDAEETGLLFQKNNEKSMIQTLNTVLINLSLTKAISIKAAQKVTARLNWKWNANEVCCMLGRAK
ncbi:glycosyltransferase [uncultured Desulfuromusa sp.]|uniref:glycosyltransferase n=1 Tax=uncultured Desulfuromusa sp. TaxID=219183 RepID=UPI002AA7434B|nr:glycosyltransferase [uncultured Desulfuromusa sp.]